MKARQWLCADGVVAFLALPDVLALRCASRAFRALCDAPHVRAALLSDPARLGRLLVCFRAPDTPPGAGASLAAALRDAGVRVRARMQVYFPEILGYSLIQPARADVERRFDLVLADGLARACAATRAVLRAFPAPDWVVLVSEPPDAAARARGNANSNAHLRARAHEDALAARRCGPVAFEAPYKTYWIRTTATFHDAADSRQRARSPSGLLSLSAQPVCAVPELHEAQQPVAVGNLLPARAAAAGGALRAAWVARADDDDDQVNGVQGNGGDGDEAVTRVASAEAQPRRLVRTLYLISSSSRSSRVRIERVAMAVHRAAWATFVRALASARRPSLLAV